MPNSGQEVMISSRCSFYRSFAFINETGPKCLFLTWFLNWIWRNFSSPSLVIHQSPFKYKVNGRRCTAFCRNRKAVSNSQPSPVMFIDFIFFMSASRSRRDKMTRDGNYIIIDSDVQYTEGLHATYIHTHYTHTQCCILWTHFHLHATMLTLVHCSCADGGCSE